MSAISNSGNEAIIEDVRHWLEKAVLGLNLCPFAARPYSKQAVHFAISDAEDDAACLEDLYRNLLRMDEQVEIETTLLICARHLGDFNAYNDFLGLAELLLEQGGWQGVYQIASFHPDYRFAGTEAKDRGNWTNRSPYPLLHLIREASVSSAVASYADIGRVAEANISKLESLSDDEMKDIFAATYDRKDGDK